MKDIKKLLEMRKNMKNRRPKFRRQGYGIYPRIGDEWRKPRGRHSKQKHQSAGHAKKVKPGFRSPKLVRGMDKHGLIPVIVNSIVNIPLLKKEEHGAIIGGSVGNRKRLILLNELKKHGIKVLNLPENHDKKIQENLALIKKEREEKQAKKQKKEKVSKKETEKQEKKEQEISAEEKGLQEKKEKDKLLTKEQK